MARCLTDEELAEYLKNNGSRCPMCGFGEVIAEEICSVDAGATCRVYCSCCGASWFDMLEITGVYIDYEGDDNGSDGSSVYDDTDVPQQLENRG